MVVGLAFDLTVKLVPATRALIVYLLPVVVLHVTPRRAPTDESSVMKISLSFVTEVVLTVIVLVPFGSATFPAGAAPHTAGEAGEAQLLAVSIS